MGLAVRSTMTHRGIPPSSGVRDLREAVSPTAGLSADELLTRVYVELRRLAAGQMARESAAHTLQPTALVHEAWLRLGGAKQADGQSGRHFLGAAAQARRQIVIERPRRRRAVKHGGDMQRADAAEIDAAGGRTDNDSVVAVGEALDRFERIDPQ